MKRISWIAVLLFSLTTALLTACGSPEGPAEPSKPELVNVKRWWEFDEIYEDQRLYVTVQRGIKDGFGVIDESYSYLPKIFYPPDLTQPTIADVHSSEYGGTYWVRTQAPGQFLTSDPIGSSVLLQTVYYYKKTQATATLEFVISDIELEGLSAIPNDLDIPCYPPAIPGEPKECKFINESQYVFGLFGIRDGTQNTGNLDIFADNAGWVSLVGWQFQWEVEYANSFATASNFEFDEDVDHDGGLHALVRLKNPIHIIIPLDKIEVNEIFHVQSAVRVVARNGVQTEFYMGAYFRDPVSSGVQIHTVGLDPVAPPREIMPLPEVPVCTTGPDPDAGTLEFEVTDLNSGEHNAAHVIVSRTGGSKGTVSVVVTTADGSALAGQDYAATADTVIFADGSDGTRVVNIPIIGDDLLETDETFTASLVDVRGCAALGASSATVTIIDDDLAGTFFSVGGMVTGLVGSGLVLSKNSGDAITVGNGPFTFPTKVLQGRSYTIAVATQPGNPVQVCTVTNGSGTINGADVTNVLVTCSTPPPVGSLDPDFNGTGKVATSNVRAVKSMALQSSGRILVLSDLGALTRYNTDGTQDMTFGTNGVVIVSFNTTTDTPRGIAVQSDDKIVVVGRALSGTFDDFGVARFNADGSPDASFGSSGILSIDINNSYDEAWVPLIQSDDKILVVGNGGTGSGPSLDTDFTVVRLSDTGVLDTTFDTDGKASVNIAGLADLVSSAVLQSDDKIVVGGRVGLNGGANPDFGVVRFDADGSLDLTFGGGTGKVRLDLAGGGNSDEVTDLALQSDGKIVAAVQARIGGVSYQHAIERLKTDGTPDGSFGTNGLATQSFAAGGDYARAVAIDTNDRIVTAGYTRTNSSTSDDFLVTRHNANGSLDTSFASNGKQIVDFFSTADGGECIAIQSDGKIVAAGSALNGSINGLAIIRILP